VKWRQSSKSASSIMSAWSARQSERRRTERGHDVRLGLGAHDGRRRLDGAVVHPLPQQGRRLAQEADDLADGRLAGA